MKIEKAAARKARQHQVYKVDDVRVPGVTTILGVINKPALLKWANKLGLEGIDSTTYVDELAAIGTLAHEMIQEYLGGPVYRRDDYTKAQVDTAENAVISFFEWERQTGHVMKTEAIELQLTHSGLMYGGTIDWYGTIDGKKWLVDIKTSKGLFPEHVYQVAAYRRLLIENNYKVDGVRLLRVGRTEDEGFDDHVISSTQLHAAWQVFTAARKLYEAQKHYDKYFK